MISHIRWIDPPVEHNLEGGSVKLRTFLSAGIALVLLAGSACAAGYTKNSEGLYVNSSGEVISELWDDEGGLYIVNGVGYSINDADKNPEYTQTENETSYNPQNSGIPQNSDGSITVESGQYAAPGDPQESSGQHLTEEEWAARWAKYSSRLGSTSGTVYRTEDGQVFPVEILSLGLGRSTVQIGQDKFLVPTSSLEWDHEVSEDKVLAVVYPKKQGHVTLRAKSSAKAFVMAQAAKCSVARVIRSGKTWSLVDVGGIRGYCYTSTLIFYDNKPRQYTTGTITINGKTPRGADFTVHVRDASSKGSQIAEFVPGTPITVFALDNQFYEADVEGLHCYVMKDFVTLDAPLRAVTAEEPKEEEKAAEPAVDYAREIPSNTLANLEGPAK